MLVDGGAQLQFLEIDRFLLLAGLVGLFLLLVFKLPVIENFGDRRLGVGRNLDQIKPRLFRQAQRLADIDDARLFAGGID